MGRHYANTNFNGCVLRLEALTGKPENEEEAADKVTEKLRERRIKVPELLTLFNGESRKQKQEAVTLHNYEGNSAICNLQIDPKGRCKHKPVLLTLDPDLLQYLGLYSFILPLAEPEGYVISPHPRRIVAGMRTWTFPAAGVILRPPLAPHDSRSSLADHACFTGAFAFSELQ